MMSRNIIMSIMFACFTQRFASSFLATSSLRRVGTGTAAAIKPAFYRGNQVAVAGFRNRFIKHRSRTCSTSTHLNNATTESQEEKTLESTWDIAELKKEAARLTLRCMKKVGKASTRLSKANDVAEELRTNPDATDEELQACPDIKSMEQDLADVKERLVKLNELEEKLQSVKNGKSKQLPEDIARIAIDLGVNDAPPKRQPRGSKKKKGPRKESPRKPYFNYYSENNTQIRVGRRSEDNDELSCNPKHGDGPDWWMHASGCPGSHVVIRCHDEQLDKDVKLDAAALAARQSKCQGSTIKVSLTRWRDVKKPPGAKPGLVSLTGKVQTVSVNMKEAQKRLERLDATKE